MTMVTAPPGARTAPSAAARPQAAPALASTVTGPWNRLAHEAARRFVESRGAWSRILLVAGAAGNGKTHLLAAMEAGLREGQGRRPATVRVGCDDFMRQFTYASTQGRMAAFRQKYRSTEVLMMDDVDRLSGRAATQEEFQHLFDHLDTAGRSIVLSTTRRLRDIEGLRKPLLSRLAAAMQVRLDFPDDAGRRSLLQSAALRDRRTLAPEVLAAAAEAKGSVLEVLDRWSKLRELATISVAAAAAAAEPERPAGPTLASILDAVARRFGLAPKDITGSGRARRLTTPRHVGLFLAKKLTAHSLQEIATFFGGLNHATVLYACRKVEEEMEKAPALKRQVEEAERASAGAVSG